MAKQTYADLGISREASIAHYKTVMLKGEVAQHPTNPDQFLVIPVPNEFNGKKEPVKKAIALDKARFTESYEVMDKNGEPSYIVDLGMAGVNSTGANKGLYLPKVVDVLDETGAPTGEKRTYNDIEIRPSEKNGWQTAYMKDYAIPERADGMQPADRLKALVEDIKAGKVEATERHAQSGSPNVREQLLNGKKGTINRRYDRQLAASGRLNISGPEWLSGKSASGRSIADTTILVNADDMLVLDVEGVPGIEDGKHRFVRINDDLCVDVDPSNKATYATAHPGRGADLDLAEGIDSISYTVKEPNKRGKMVNVEHTKNGPFRLLGLPKGDEPSLKSYHTTIKNGKFMPRLDSPNTPINASNIDYQLDRGNAASNPFKASNAYAKAGLASVKHEPGMIQGTETAIFRDKFIENFFKEDKDTGKLVIKNQKIKKQHGEAWGKAGGKLSEMAKDLTEAERDDLNKQVEEQIAKYVEAAKSQPEFADKAPKTPEPKTTVQAPEAEAEVEAEPEFMDSWDGLS
jgi:hypothetical protein